MPDVRCQKSDVGCILSLILYLLSLIPHPLSLIQLATLPFSMHQIECKVLPKLFFTVGYIEFFEFL